MIRQFIIFSFVLLLSSQLLYFEGVVLFPITKLILIAISVSIVLFFLFLKKSEWRNRILLVVFTTCITISLTDLILRPVISDKIWYRPDDRFLHRHYEYPELHRFKKNVEWNGTVYGDLAAMSGEKKYRVYRDVEFITDQYGFRNYPVADNDSFDIIALGDSYTYGSGTTQDSIWTSQLEKISGLSVYNLATPGGPWAELMNLQLELPRIKLKKNAKVIWMLFSGNDLVDYYGDPDFKNLKRNKGWKKYWAMVQGWRYRSPISMLIRKNKSVKDSVLIKSTDILYYKPHEDTNYQDKMSEISKEKMVSTLDYMKIICEQVNLDLTILVADSKTTLSINSFKPIVGRWVNGNKVNIIDLAYFLLKQILVKDFRIISDSGKVEQETQMFWWNDDTHYNNIGNKVVAEIIYEQLKGDLLLPAE